MLAARDYSRFHTRWHKQSFPGLDPERPSLAYGKLEEYPLDSRIR